MDIRPYCFIMRGIPGSGKSTLAKEFADTFNCVICSADDFFMKDGVYKWYNAGGANHKYCQKLFNECISSRENVIVDNTNVKPSDYNYYIKSASDARYEIYFVEPANPWSLNVDECFLRNTHKVPKDTIAKMHKSLVETSSNDARYRTLNRVVQVYGD